MQKKSIKATNRTIEAIKNAESRFKECFGRAFAKNDPIFFEQYYHSGDDFDDSFTKAALEAKVRPEILYANKRTGFIISESNHHMFNEEQKQAWEDAIDEYEYNPDPELLDMPLGFASSPEEWLAFKEMKGFFDNKLYASVLHLGSFINKLPKRRPLETDSFLVYYFATRTIHALRTFHRWSTQRYSDDIVCMTRGVYENWIRTLFLVHDPEHSNYFFALTGVQNGTHRYSTTKKGKVNRRIIVNNETGEETVGHVSNREMLEISGTELDVRIYDYIYPVLSQDTHYTLDKGFKYFSFDKGFQIHKDDLEDSLDIIILTTFSILMYFATLRECKHTIKIQRRDLKYISNELLTILDILINLEGLNFNQEIKDLLLYKIDELRL